ncbi:MAG TPA: helix-turn-helix domain-containing protein [Polyangiaceae bacterium]|jgi:AcrR family transcriptional regulator
MSRTADPTAKIHLLRASEEVFAERGLALAKVEEITRRAGTSKGAFYLHFSSKEEAFKQVVESFLARIGARLPSLPDAMKSAETPEEALEFWRTSDADLYEILWQNRAIVSILQGCQGEWSYLLETFTEAMHERTVEWISHWKSIAFFREEIDTELAATLLLGAHTELSRKMVTSTTKPPIADWVAKAQAVFVRGFGMPVLIDALRPVENPPVSLNLQRAPAPPVSQGAPRRRSRASG